MNENSKMQETMAAADMCAKQAQGYMGVDWPCRLSLNERVEAQLNRSMREAKRAERLQVLAYLLNKHPDIARILDLVDEVRS